MAIGATVVSLSDVSAFEFTVAVSSLGVDVTDSITDSSTDVFAFMVPNDVVCGSFAVFAVIFTAVPALVVVLEDAFKINCVVVSYTGVVMFVIDAETCVSSVDEFVAKLDDSDDFLFVVVVCRDVVFVAGVVSSEC